MMIGDEEDEEWGGLAWMERERVQKNGICK